MDEQDRQGFFIVLFILCSSHSHALRGNAVATRGVMTGAGVAEIISAAVCVRLVCLYRWRGVSAFPRGAWE